MREQALSFMNARGRRLAAVLSLPDAAPPAAVTVLCHGMLSGKNSPKHILLAQRLAALGVAAFRFDFTSRYESEGPIEEMTYGQGVADLGSAVATVRERLGDLPLGLYGSSMGGAVVLLYAAQEGGAAALATIAAVGRPGTLWSAWAGPDRIALWRERGWMRFEGYDLPFSFYLDTLERDAVAAAARIQAPLLVVHGERDAIVPVQQARDIHAAAAGPKRLVLLPDGDHTFSRPSDLERMLGEVSGWLSAHLG